MTNTTKAWLLCHPIVGYFIIVAIISVLAFLVNRPHWAIILGDMEGSNFIFYFWIVLSPFFIAGDIKTVGGLIFSSICILLFKAMIIFCYFADSTGEVLPIIVTLLDLVATVLLIAPGIKIGKWTYANMDEVIPKRWKWKKSKVDIYSYSLKYSINRGIACAYCAYCCVAVALLFIVIR